MKTFRKVVLLLIVFVFAAYFSPFTFAGENQNPIVTPNESFDEQPNKGFDMKTSQLDQSLVPASGFANYTGMAVDDFIVEFGEPEEIKELNENEELWLYGTDGSDFIQLRIENYVISEILVLGSEVNIAPFEIGMSRNEIYQTASFHPNFEVPFEGQTVQVQLNENELNNQPLIAFDNHTYAVLTIDSQTDNLIGVQYMTNANLIHSDFYEKSPFSAVTEEDSVKANLAAQEKLKAELTIHYINVMRTKADLDPLESSLVLTAFGNELYDYDNQLRAAQNAESEKVSSGTPTETNDDALVISEEADVQKIKGTSSEDTSKEQEEKATVELLDEALIEEFLEQQNASLEQVRLIYQPFHGKPSHYTLQWFILSDYRDIMMNKEMKRIGISYRGDELLLILDDGIEIHL